MDEKDYVGLLLTKIVELEGSGWERQITPIVTGELNVQDLDDLFKELRERQKKLEYLYFCCDKELNPNRGSSLQKFKYENS